MDFAVPMRLSLSHPMNFAAFYHSDSVPHSTAQGVKKWLCGDKLLTGVEPWKLGEDKPFRALR